MFITQNIIKAKLNMKKIFINKKLNTSIFAIAAALSVCTVIFSSIAQASEVSSNYIGADALYSSMKFREYYGDNIFNKKWIPGVNLFAGHMFNDNWGVEAGYEVDKKMKRTNKVYEGDTVAGSFIDPATLVEFESYETFVKQHHAYIGAIGKKNFLSNSSLSLMLGISLSHVQARYSLFADGFGPANITRTFSKTKPIPVIRVSFEHQFNDKFGFRTIAAWKKTSKFKIKSEENQNSDSEIKLKNTFNLGVGLIYYI